MGWQFMDSGFKVLFSSDIPTIISKNVRNDITSFLDKQQLKISDIRNFIFHPGGKKVLSVLPLIKKGVYKYLKHPNYLVVMAEIAIIPLIFHLYFTAIAFTRSEEHTSELQSQR